MQTLPGIQSPDSLQSALHGQDYSSTRHHSRTAWRRRQTRPPGLAAPPDRWTETALWTAAAAACSMPRPACRCRCPHPEMRRQGEIYLYMYSGKVY